MHQQPQQPPQSQQPQQPQQPQMNYYQQPQMNYYQQPQMNYYQQPQQPQMGYYQQPQMNYYQQPQMNYYQQPQQPQQQPPPQPQHSPQQQHSQQPPQPQQPQMNYYQQPQMNYYQQPQMNYYQQPQTMYQQPQMGYYQQYQQYQHQYQQQEKERLELEKRLSDNENIIRNISKLEEWCESDINQVLYNSTIDGKECDIFRNKILNHSHLYFIVVDQNDNVFGHYHPSKIDRIDAYVHDKNIFMFTLFNNERGEIEKYKNIGDDTIGTYVLKENDYYYLGSGDSDGYRINEENQNSYLLKKISNRFEIKNSKTIVKAKPDKDVGIPFQWKEIIVIEMKETEEEKREKEEHEKKFKEIKQEYIFGNMQKLEEWSNREFKEVIYNSTTDGKSSKIFRNKVLNHSHLYFITIDDNNNVFGHYHPSRIDKTENYIYDKNIFMFTLFSNERGEIEKFKNIGDDTIGTYFFKDNDYYYLGSGNSDGYRINEKPKNCFLLKNVANRFDIKKKTKVIVGKEPDKENDIAFHFKEIIVIEMKETEEEKREREEREREFKEIEQKYIFNNMIQLEEWSGAKFKEVIYNSTTDGKTSEIFRNKITNHSSLYFIVTDENNNVFGHYHPSLINETDATFFDKDIFMFSLNSNGRSGIEKYYKIGDDKVETQLQKDDNFYYSGGNGFTGYNINSVSGSINRNITEKFSVKDKIIFTGGIEDGDGDIIFKWKEIMVIEMKEPEERIRQREKEREEFKNKYIFNKIPLLEEWSGSKYNQVIYNSAVDGKTNEAFRNKIMNHSNLYFIVIDAENNVFGHYHPSEIEGVQTKIYDKDIFMFSLYSNGRTETEKYCNTGNKYTFTYIYDEKDFYYTSSDQNDGYIICSTIVSDNSGIYRNISNTYKTLDKTKLTCGEPNEDGDVPFQWKEMIVIEMKETIEEKQRKEREIKEIEQEYIFDNMQKLEEWSKCRFKDVIYNSTTDGKSGKIFRNKVLKHSHLYFIVIDDKNNVFGHYHPSEIDIVLKYVNDKNIFMFSLNSNGRTKIDKFKNNAGNKVFTCLDEDDSFYYCGCNGSTGYNIHSKYDLSFINKDITNTFSVKDKKIYTGGELNESGSIPFRWKEIIVIEMEK